MKLIDESESRKLLKMVRKCRNITQAQMSKKLGVTPATYNKWELGTVKFPYGRLNDIGKILEIDPTKFVTFDSITIEDLFKG